MQPREGPVDEEANREGSLLVLAVLCALVGAVSGLVGAVFRLTLERADQLRDLLAQGQGFVGFAVVTATCAAATAAAAWGVRRIAPQASGSGIPRVEAVLQRELPPAPYQLIAVKFLGGVLAIGSGLALGREGPSVQMGATLANLVGKLFRRGWPDCRALLAAGAGAGLATAFNAPIAGAVFVLEELVRRFETRIAITALGASATAIAVARLFLGDGPDYHVEPLPYPHWDVHVLCFVLGLIAGLLAIAYNRTLLATIATADQCPAVLRAALVGAAVGMLAWVAPGVVGGGDPLTQRALGGTAALGVIPLVFLLRFGLSTVSYAAGTPGGLFAPMLVLGAQLGQVYGTLCQLAFPDLGVPPEGFAIVGMAAFFAGVVRAPITSIILIIEMTANFTMLLPMLGACFAAMLLTTVLGNPPIYDSLRPPVTRSGRAEAIGE